MDINTTTLADLMAMLHELNPRRLTRCRNNHTGRLKQLRLVSKEICGLAQNAVHNCSVHLGDGGPSPSPEQLIRLMAGTQLQKLTVTLTVTTGFGAPTLDQQQSYCSQQMDCLLAGLGKAMESVTFLTLHVVYPVGSPEEMLTARADADLVSTNQRTRNLQKLQEEQQHRQQQQQQEEEKEARQLSHNHMHMEQNEGVKHEAPSSDCDECDDEYDYHNIHQPLPTVRTCPEALGQMAGHIFERLAVAVPNLQQLHVCGSCWDFGLGTFGTHCPLLSTLEVDIQHVPFQALDSLGSNLPNLTRLSLGSYRFTESEEAQLGTYMDAAFNRAKDCLKLTDLNIDITEYVTLTCKPESWGMLPTSLQHLHCSCSVEESEGYTALLCRLPSLTLKDCPFSGFLENLVQFPLLRSLAILGAQRVTFDCGEDDYSYDHLLIKERLLSTTFELSVFHMHFNGTCKEVHDVFAWLPEFPNIASVTLDFMWGKKPGFNPVAHCLARIPALFPNMQFITLSGWVCSAVDASMDMSFFTPLMTCTQLENLTLKCEGLPMTTAGLVHLCSSLGNLNTLNVKRCRGVDMAILVGDLKKLVRKVPISISTRLSHK